MARWGLLLGCCLWAPPGLADPKPPTRNGFSLVDSLVPAAEILRGGPARDGIPALDHPEALLPAEAAWPDDTPILGVTWNGEARAYPIPILDWHELVNDSLGGRPILVSYCPLCGTGIVFDRRVAGQVRRFGVSGLLYRSDVLMYDRESESLWSQIASLAIAGSSRGERLVQVRSRMLPLADWRREQPRTTVVTRNTGIARDYARSPYGDYASSDRLHFPVPRDRRYHPKMPTLGLRVPGHAARAYPASELARSGGWVEEKVGGARVRIAYDPERQVFAVDVPERFEVVEGYWFAWAAFHPETSVFVATASGQSGSGTQEASVDPEDPDS